MGLLLVLGLFWVNQNNCDLVGNLERHDCDLSKLKNNETYSTGAHANLTQLYTGRSIYFSAINAHYLFVESQSMLRSSSTRQRSESILRARAQSNERKDHCKLG